MKDDIGYKILFAVIIILIIIGYREGDRKVKLAEENEDKSYRIEELEGKLEDLEWENEHLYERISELESRLEEYEP